MENQEEVLDALDLFEKKPSKDIPELLDQYLVQVAKTGETVFPWLRIKPLFTSKVNQVMEQFNLDAPYDHLLPYPNVEHAKYDEMKTRILEAIENFRGAPFTVQRICELVTEPRKHYKRSDKFLRGVEKNVLVVSTVDPFGRKIVSEPSRALMNGLDVSRTKTEAQPFVPVPRVNWSANKCVASIWPTTHTDTTTNLATDGQPTVDLKSEETVDGEPRPIQENGDVTVTAMLDADLPSQKPDSDNVDTCNDCVVSDSVKPFVFETQSPCTDSGSVTENVVTEYEESGDVKLDSSELAAVEDESQEPSVSVEETQEPGVGEPRGVEVHGEEAADAAPQDSDTEVPVADQPGEAGSTPDQDPVLEATSEQPHVAEAISEETRDEHAEDSTGVGTPEPADTAIVPEEKQDICSDVEVSCPEPVIHRDSEPSTATDEPQAGAAQSKDMDEPTNQTQDRTDVCQSDISSSDDTDQSETTLQNNIQSDTVSENDQSPQESVSQSDSTTHVSEVCESAAEKSESTEESEVSDTVGSQCDADTEVKHDGECSETISSSESMDVDSQVSDKMEEASSQSDIVTTTGLQEAEEPMEQE